MLLLLQESSVFQAEAKGFINFIVKITKTDVSVCLQHSAYIKMVRALLFSGYLDTWFLSHVEEFCKLSHCKPDRPWPN